jgi:putative ABC transport system permease protein
MLRRLRSRLRALFARDQVERELEDELRFHIELETEMRVGRGMARDEARYSALRDFGGVSQVAERCRQERGVEWMETVVQDLRYGLRVLRRQPGFTVLALLVLALGIGANAAIFSMARAVLLRPLPFENGERLVTIEQGHVGVARDHSFSATELQDFREQSRTLQDIVEYHSMSFTLLGHGEPARVTAGVVSARHFEVLGTKALLGRTFAEDEDQHGAPAALLLSHAYWQRHFGGDPAVIGRAVEMNDRLHTVVGVLPPLPQYPDENDVFMPVSSCPWRTSERNAHGRDARTLAAFGLLKPGVAPEAAQADLSAIAARLHAEYPEAYPPGPAPTIRVVSLREELALGFRPTLTLLLGTAVLMLLIVCANVANLTLARVLGRQRELSIRAALGAGRGRLLRQLASESVLLALAGGALGLGVAALSMDLLIAFAQRFTPRAAEIRIDGVVLLVTLGVSVVTGLVFGTVPALSRGRLLLASGAAGRHFTDGHERHRLRSVLVAAQVAFSILLLVGAGLMIRTLLSLHGVNPGFRPENVLSMRLDLNWSKYDDAAKRRAFFRETLERVSGLPGVVSAAVTGAIPLDETFRASGRLDIEGRTLPEGEARPAADRFVVSADYFRTLGVPVLRGRGLEERDDANAAGVVVLSQRLARQHWGEDDPVGARVSLNGGETWAEVIGVVGDALPYRLDEDAAAGVYLSYLQRGLLSMGLLIRTAGDPNVAVQQVLGAIRAIDPRQPIAGVRTLEQIRQDSIAAPRLTTGLLGLFAAVALMVTSLGIGAVMALSVGERTREIGIRMALGSSRTRVLFSVLRQGLAAVLAGTLLGVALAVPLARVMSGLLHGVPPFDPWTVAGTTIVLLFAAVAACVVPARRAAGVDPATALRCD